MLMMFEWWASEAIIFMAGMLPGDTGVLVSAMSIYQNTLAIAFMVPSSIHVAASTRVGNALGAGQAATARFAAATAPLLAFACCCVTSLALYCFGQGSWPLLFTQDQRVAAVVNSVFPVLVVSLCVTRIWACQQCSHDSSPHSTLTTD